QRHKIKPEAITLEITEQVALRNVEANLNILERARRAGMSIALDDFGTGYSSLSMLDRLPLDRLKIDQSLLRGDEKNLSENAILKGAIRLARELGLTCCVEGVSSAEIATQVMRLGANEVPGFWIGRPTLIAPGKPLELKAS
ncbi:MAG: EAL domain-containing protein, partial [Henriciella sp.]|uniref:EAL domain-containing protein n=1 Tax=Henriciella sp. TaxID=1968823 RepID=UPI003C767F1F